MEVMVRLAVPSSHQDCLHYKREKEVFTPGSDVCLSGRKKESLLICVVVGGGVAAVVMLFHWVALLRTLNQPGLIHLLSSPP